MEQGNVGGEERSERGASYGDARSLNPQAGHHAVTRDPVELAAAARAVTRSWAEFPYYARRYGARGRAFSASDSGWLVTLCDLTPAVAVSQARWLGSVLSARGMPQWLLERHLDLLHEELAATLPERAAHYEALGRCAANLRTLRRAHLADDDFAALEAAFDERVGAPWNRRLRRMGGILAAAVADERAGLSHAVASVESWATDAEHFPAEWIAAVTETIADARRRAR
ncbi:MAG TPA: hypothetical protein VFJ74_03930 [Gemmatimonadaceae bacterium]|nr:hypothetical protein [Gemmatimonadaceae bacterium]